MEDIEKMKCGLCDKPMQNYNRDFNHLKIDESHSIDVCQGCVDRFLKWQQDIFARIFPTTFLKKRFEKSK